MDKLYVWKLFAYFMRVFFLNVSKMAHSSAIIIDIEI